MASDDITRWGELTLKSGKAMDDGEAVDAALDLDDFQFWFEPHPEFPGSMRITINLSGKQWTDLKNIELVKARSGQKARRVTPASDDGVSRVVAMLQEPSAELLTDISAEVFGTQYDDDDARESNADRGRYGPDRLTRRLCARAACRAIASYIEEHARPAPRDDTPTRDDLIRERDDLRAALCTMYDAYLDSPDTECSAELHAAAGHVAPVLARTRLVK